MPEDHNNNEHDDQKRVERANHPPEQSAVNIGLLSPGTVSEFDPGFADDTRSAAAGASPPPPEYPASLLGDPVLYEHGNEPVRISVFQSAQHIYGNKAVQRHIGNLPVQRDNTSLPPVPNVVLTPPSILQPDNQAGRYGLSNQFRFRIDPRTEVMMRQYTSLQFDSTLPTLQSAATSFQPSGGPTPPGTGQQSPPGGGSGATPPAGGGGTGQGQGAPPPAAPPTGGGGSGTPSQPGAGPSTPQPASPGQIVSAALASEPFKTAWTNLQNSMINQAAADWRRLRVGEKVALISTGATIAIGALAGITLTDDPSARQLLLGQLNGQTLPVPGVNWLRVEMNTSGEALMFGLHGDIGSLLGPRFGFRASGASPIGGPPQPTPSLPTPPPPVQRTLQRMEAWHNIGTPGSSTNFAGIAPVQRYRAAGESAARNVAIQRDEEEAPKPPTAKKGKYTTTFKSTSSTWTVSGATLSEAATEIMSREEAGETSWTPAFSVDLDDAGNVRGASVEITINVMLPEWPEAAKLKGVDKKEWKSFMAALKRHEAGHVALVKKKLKGIAKKMKGKTETEADEILQKALDELKEASDAYDDKNDHGRGAGTVLEVEEEEATEQAETQAEQEPEAIQPMRAGAVPGSSPITAPGLIGGAVPVQRDGKAPAAPPPALPSGPKVNFKPVVNTTYTVTGKTLKAAAEQMMAREEAGETTWKPAFTEAHDDNGKITGATVDVTITVLLPTWSEAAQLKGDEKTTWDNFMTALKAHEQHHVDLVKEKLKGVADEMIGKSKTEATELLQKALDALKKSSDDYDTETDHGKKEGVNIDTEEEAPPAKDAEESSPNAKSSLADGQAQSLTSENDGFPVQRRILLHENAYVQRFLSGDRVADLAIQRDTTTKPAPKTKNFGEVQKVLEASATGQAALSLMTTLKVGVSLKAGASIGYFPVRNSMLLDSNQTPVFLALAFAHEMNHAKEAKASTPSMERAKHMQQDEFVKAMLKEEAESDLQAYDMKYELLGKEVDLTDALPPGKNEVEQMYRTTILNSAIEAQIKKPDITGREMNEIGRAAGKAAVIDHFQNKPGHEGHRTHYEKQWKDANPGK